jgi:hypothetical protein
MLIEISNFIPSSEFYRSSNFQKKSFNQKIKM